MCKEGGTVFEVVTCYIKFKGTLKVKTRIYGKENTGNRYLIYWISLHSKFSCLLVRMRLWAKF